MKKTPHIRNVSIRATTETKALIEEFRQAKIRYYANKPEGAVFAEASAAMSEDVLIRIALRTAAAEWTKDAASK